MLPASCVVQPQAFALRLRQVEVGSLEEVIGKMQADANGEWASVMFIPSGAPLRQAGARSAHCRHPAARAAGLQSSNDTLFGVVDDHCSHCRGLLHYSIPCARKQVLHDQSIVITSSYPCWYMAQVLSQRHPDASGESECCELV